MGAGHSHALYVHEHSLLHHQAAATKVAATVVFVVCVAVTPREAVWAFGVYALVVASLTMIGRIPPSFVLTRLSAIVPFVLFAVFIPFIAGGPQVSVVGLELSVEGLWASWNILAKAALGAGATIVLTATTEIPDIIRGMGDLRVPSMITSIAMFMVRYLELVSDELRRMRVAMASRGYDPRWLAQARPIATGAGALFVRSYERGERVHAAMLARGFNGTMPRLGHSRPRASDWIIVAMFSAPCVLIAVIAAVNR